MNKEMEPNSDYFYELGDFVGFRMPDGKIIKKGIVIDRTEDSFMVKWMSYDKEYYLEEEDKAFGVLNASYILTTCSYNIKNKTTGYIQILSKVR